MTTQGNAPVEPDKFEKAYLTHTPPECAQSACQPGVPQPCKNIFLHQTSHDRIILHSTHLTSCSNIVPSLPPLASRCWFQSKQPTLDYPHIAKQTHQEPYLRLYQSSPHPICMAPHASYKLAGSNIPKLHRTITVPHTKHISLFQVSR